MDGELRAVEGEHRVAVDELRAERVVAAKVVYLVARVVSEVHRLLEHVAPPEVQIAARDVERRQEQVRRRGRLRERDYLADVVGVHGAARKQHGALRERAARLVDRRRRHVAPRSHRRHRQLLVEVEVRAMRLVGQDAHPRGVREAHDLGEVRADAVVRRVVDEYRLCGRMRGDRPLHVLDAHAERDADAFLLPGVDVDGHRAAHDERVDRTAVHIARQYYLVARRARRHDHRLHRRRRAVHHEERVVRAERLGREALRLAYDRYGVRQVVERLHGVYVHRHRPRAEVLRKLRVAAPAFVGRHVEVR